MTILNIAHRGASGYFPENTMKAFEEAYEMGCEGIETDVQFTKDKVMVLCHDETVDRTTNGKGQIVDYTYNQLSRLNTKGYKIPTLEELLCFAKDKNLFLNLEIKNEIIPYEGIEASLLDMIYKHNLQDNIIISSFNHYSIVKCKEIDKNIKVGLLYMCKLYKPEIYAKAIGAEALHPLYMSLSEKIVREIKKDNILINTYTVNDEEDMKKMISFGVDGIITNYPDKLKKLLKTKELQCF